MRCVWVKSDWKTGDDKECPFEGDREALAEKYGEDEFAKHFFEMLCKFCLEGQKVELLSKIMDELDTIATMSVMRDR